MSIPTNTSKDFLSFCHSGTLQVEKVACHELVKQFNTPLFVYSRSILEKNYQQYAKACANKNASVFYAVKANSNLAILNLFTKLGSGFDIVSGGELKRVLASGGEANKIIFSGVGKSTEEIELAIKTGIYCFNVESASELDRLAKISMRLKKIAPISLRINPNVDPETHPYISTGLKNSKFGISLEEALPLYRYAHKCKNLKIIGIDCHIGSQITSTQPHIEALACITDLAAELISDGMPLKHIDIGGGLGIQYQEESVPVINNFVNALINQRNKSSVNHLHLILEPGRSIVGNSGIMLTRVEYLKHNQEKNFIIVDAAMNDLIRPTLYQAHHEVIAIQKKNGTEKLYDIVGPVCESGDWLARNCKLCVEENDILAVRSCGAYGFVMSSNYNTRPRAAEVMVDDHAVHLIRPRETVDSLFENERLLPIRK